MFRGECVWEGGECVCVSVYMFVFVCACDCMNE